MGVIEGYSEEIDLQVCLGWTVGEGSGSKDRLTAHIMCFLESETVSMVDQH